MQYVIFVIAGCVWLCSLEDYILTIYTVNVTRVALMILDSNIKIYACELDY